MIRDERTGTCWIEVDLGALRSNYRLARNLVDPGIPIIAVVKAEAYGHGSLEVSRVLLEEGASTLAVATVSEAADLRKAGIHGPILIMGRMLETQAKTALRWGAEITITHMSMAKALSSAAVRKGVTAPVHIKVDTGMTRLGLPWETAHRDILEIVTLPALELRCVFTHFANADLADQEFTRIQVKRFDLIRRQLVQDGVQTCFHIANSAAILTSQGLEDTGVRPGIMLYGSAPSKIIGGEGLTPVLSWKCKVLQVKEVPSGTGISYGHDFYTQRPSRIATISVGYADGYLRSLTNNGYVLVREMRAPVVGRVTMDMTMVDVTDIPGVDVGDEVVLIGTQGGSTITAEELASWAGTISYEIFCAISHRVKRVYRDSSESKKDSSEFRVQSSE
jgi:alanine racemase